jgi:hypothetical protein
MAPIESDKCPICLDNLNNRCKIHTTACNHQFHLKCFNKIKTDNCPCCRSIIPKDKKKLIQDLKAKIKVVTKNLASYKQNFKAQVKMVNSSINNLKTKLKIEHHHLNKIMLVKNIIPLHNVRISSQRIVELSEQLQDAYYQLERLEKVTQDSTSLIDLCTLQILTMKNQLSDLQ